MEFLEIHNFLDQSMLSFFDHEHLWFHVVSHIVLVVMPVIFLALVIRWICLFLIWGNSFVSIKTLKSTAANDFSLPSSLMGFIIRYSGNSQIILALLALSTLPITYLQLELPKQIINGAITTETSNDAFGVAIQQLNSIDFLLVLCAMYLAALIASSVLKYILNNKMGVTSERLLRRVRLIAVRKRNAANGSSSRIPVITQEVEPVCSFSGDAIIVPLLYGGTVVTIITFMMIQNVVLGAAAITLLPIQLIIIPKLQKKINQQVRKRVAVIRQLSEELQSENQFSGRSSIRGHVEELHGIRIKIFRVKYLMKSLNNFIMNLTPFFFYTIGGYLVLEQRLSLGALVASLASYKDLAPAIRELFNYYQRSQDAKQRYFEVRKYLLSEES